MKSSSSITLDALRSHNRIDDCWIAIDGVVYDVTKFLNVHPAGKQVILSVAGKDVTSEFYSFHKRDILDKYGEKLKVGLLESSEKSLQVSADDEPFDVYTPFAESSFTRGWKSPYMNPSHHEFRRSMREFMVKHIIPTVEQVHERGQDPDDEIFSRLGQAGILASRCGPCAMPYVTKLGMTLPGGISASDFDYFHEQIAIDEIYRCGSGGVADGLGGGLTIGLPPVINFGRKKLRERIVPECLLGNKRICLAITEPGAGSDVANIQMTAKLNFEKTHYIVNGVKKWITGGYVADYFTTAVRTGGPGHQGISLLLIESPSSPGSGSVSRHKIKTSYSGAAGTSLLIFDNVLVPRENLLGQEGDGFKLIMANFNHERWYICAISSAFGRHVVGECYRWAIGRKAFGKRLIDQPVIRYKLAEMSAAVECLDSWLESITYQMNTMDMMEQYTNLSAPIALCKFLFTRQGVMLGDNACQIFGGRAVTRTGMGRIIEYFKNELKLAAILGGSEEIVADLAVRQVTGQAKKLEEKKNEAKVMLRL
jgi:alkylation response protein AidB-like acyl-CoA dehydrogenase/predicted heme/steroid binding protein